MAISTCLHCENNSFEFREGASSAKYRLVLVQCINGAPFGTRESYDYRALLPEQDVRIKNIEHQVSAI